MGSRRSASNLSNFYRLSLSTGILPLLLVIYSVSLPACSANNTRADEEMPAHHTDNGFRNLYLENRPGGFFTFLRMRYFGDEEWADYEATAWRVDSVITPLDKVSTPGAQPQVTWIGHATTLVQFQGINVLTDPNFSERASPFSFMGHKRARPPSLRIDQLPPIDFVLISHNHYDHLDKQTVKTLGNRTTWVVPLGHKQWFADLGVNNVIEFDWWQSRTIGSATITATPSQHWSGRGLNDRYRALWASWSVQIGTFKFWVAGDTGYNDKIFIEIGARCGPFDLALIPVGGYDPHWFMKDMHLNPEEAVLVHSEIRSKYSLGIHWGTFPLTAEPIDEPPVRLQKAAESLKDSVFVTYPLGKTGEIEGRY
jgi:N-acyl-phosphatidylethanolamine-hydrolysing phospholipase D